MQVSVWCGLKELRMTTQRQEENEQITILEMLEIIFTTIREYEGTTGILRKHNQEQGA